MSLTRKGGSLIEVLIALVLTGMLAALIADVLSSAAYRLRDRSERMGAEQGLRTAAAAVRAALESLAEDSSSGPDLLSTGATGFRARVVRAAGTACGTEPGRFLARAGPLWWRALRDPVPGRDSILAGPLDSTGWRIVALAAAPRAAQCPDGSAALELPIASDSATLAGLGSGSPLRIVEAVELRQYSAAPDQWLGMQLLATGQFIQPFAGPLAASGFTLDYQTRAGLVAALPAEVASVGFRLEFLTERPGGVGVSRGPGVRRDSVRGFVALVNAR